MTQNFNFPYKQAHISAVEFNTLVDETFSGKEQRRDVWTTPRKKWSLEFEKNKTDRDALIAFFVARKGRKEAFNFTWDSNKGGDGETYLVRFGSDQLDFSVLEMVRNIMKKLNGVSPFAMVANNAPLVEGDNPPFDVIHNIFVVGR